MTGHGVWLLLINANRRYARTHKEPNPRPLVQCRTGKFLTARQLYRKTRRRLQRHNFAAASSHKYSEYWIRDSPLSCRMHSRVMKYLLVFLLSVVPGTLSDSIGSSSHGCENNCLNSFRNMVSGMSMQSQACRYVPNYFNCLRTNCRLGDLKPYVPPASQVLSTYGFKCDLSSTAYSSQNSLSGSCVANCVSAYQSLVVSAVDQAHACHAARGFLSCLDSSCNVPSSSYITEAQRGLIAGGFSYCDLSSSASDVLSPEGKPEAEASSSGTRAGSSTLFVCQLTSLGILLFAAVTARFIFVTQL